MDSLTLTARNVGNLVVFRPPSGVQRQAAVSSRSNTLPYTKNCCFLSCLNTAGNGLSLFISSVNMHYLSTEVFCLSEPPANVRRRPVGCGYRETLRLLAFTGTLSFGDITGLEFESTKRDVKDIRGSTHSSHRP